VVCWVELARRLAGVRAALWVICTSFVSCVSMGHVHTTQSIMNRSSVLCV